MYIKMLEGPLWSHTIFSVREYYRGIDADGECAYYPAISLCPA
jgi:hypothetical protein